jgi:hypothetical protein
LSVFFEETMRKTALLPLLSAFSVLAALPAWAGNPAHPLGLVGGREDASQWPLFTAPAGGSNYAIVLVNGLVTPRLTADLQAAGATVLHYVPDNALLIRADGPAAQKILALPEVEGLKEFPERLKISPEITELIRKGGVKPAGLLVRLADHADGPAALRRLEPAARATAASSGMRFLSDSGRGPRLLLTALPEQLMAGARRLAADPDVLNIEPAPELVYFNDAARWVTQNYDSGGTGANGGNGPVHAHGINGQGQIVGYCDGGLDAYHNCYWDATTVPSPGLINPNGVPNYNQRKVIYYKLHDPALPWANCSGDDHGNHVAGTIACDSNGNGTWDAASGGNPPDGMAPAAKLAVSDCGTTDPPGIPADLHSIYQETYDVGARVHTNSWGSCYAGCFTYNTQSQDTDDYMWTHPDMLIVFAAANEGGPSNKITSPNNAKNVVTVGNTTRGTDPSASQTMANSSSRGPTGDGRIKPTVDAPGTATNSASAVNGLTSCINGEATPGGTPGHSGATTKSGTSMASPAVAGNAALIRQYFMDGWYPSGTKIAADGFTPSAALLKANLINGARKMTNHNLPCSATGCDQGYGRISLKESLYFADYPTPAPPARKLFIDDHKRGLVQGDGAVTYKFNVTATTTPFKVTLVWTDAPPATISSPNIVNNLNLKVTEPGGVNYYLGNDFNTTTGFTNVRTSGGTVDNLNVEEEVWVSAPVTGVWTVTVTPANIPVGPQPYALDVTGAFQIPVAGTPVVDSSRISDPAGNNDGAADPGETVSLQVNLREVAGSAISGLNGTLSSLGTPGVSVTSAGPQSFGNLAANGFAINAAPFQVALTGAVPCGSLIPLRLALTDGAANSYTLDFGIRAGSPGKTPLVSVVDNFDVPADGAPPDATLWTVANSTAVDASVVTHAADSGTKAVHLLRQNTAPGSVLQTKTLDFSSVKTARLDFAFWGNNILADAGGPYFRVEVCAGAVASTCAPASASWQIIYGNPNHYDGNTGGQPLNFNSNTLTPPAWSPLSRDLTPTTLIGSTQANVRFRFVSAANQSEATTAAYVDTVSLKGYSYVCSQPPASQLLLKADKTGGKVHLFWTNGIAPYNLSRFQNGATSIGPLSMSTAAYDDNVLADTSSYQWVVE